MLFPWLGRDLAANGARLLADDLFSAPPAFSIPGLWIVPLMALGALVVSVWGLAAPERALSASRLGALLGAVAVIYLLWTLRVPGVRSAGQAPGSGLWLAVLFSAGLVAQALAAAVWPQWLSRLHMRAPRVHVPLRAYPYLFLAPGLALYLLWIVGPALYTVYLSFTSWDAVSAPRWVGLENFRRLLFDDNLFREAVANNLRWLLVFVTVPVGLGLALALVFNAARRALTPLKAGFYAPLAFSFPVIGLIWAWLYNPRLGLINGLLNALGVESPPGWLADPQLAIWCIIAAAAWRQVGYVLLLYLAGLKTVDPSLLEAAQIDGAGRWRLLRDVLLPLLSPITMLVLVIAVIDSLRAFDMVQVMTRGGQGTQVLATLMYQEAFTSYRMGYGAAIAVALFALSSVCVGVYLSRALGKEFDG